VTDQTTPIDDALRAASSEAEAQAAINDAVRDMERSLRAPIAPRSLIRKLAEVMAEVERIPKSGRNEFHKYDYATEADIVAAVRKLLAERHVMILPGLHEAHREGTLTTALMTFTLCDGESGEERTFQWAGTGDDKGDKGLYKAITGGLKYFLLKTFLMPTGDDPEGDTRTDQRAEKRARTGSDRQTASGPTAGPAAPARSPHPSDDQPRNKEQRAVAELIEKADLLGMSATERKLLRQCCEDNTPAMRKALDTPGLVDAMRAAAALGVALAPMWLRLGGDVEKMRIELKDIREAASPWDPAADAARNKP
jgi:hypothetical protein